MSEQAIIGDKYPWNKNKKFLAYIVSSAILITLLLFVALPAYTNQQIQKHETQRIESEKEEKDQQELNVLGEKEENLEEEEREETTSTITPSTTTTTSSSTSTTTPSPTSTPTPSPTSTTTPAPTSTTTPTTPPPPTTTPEKTYDCTDEEMAGLIEERKNTMLAIADLTNIKMLEIYECKQEISGSLSSCITVCENKTVRQEVVDACIASCRSKWIVSSCDSYYNSPTHEYNVLLNSLNRDLIGINSSLDLCYLERK